MGEMAEIQSGFSILMNSAQTVFSGLVNKLIIAAIIIFIGFIAGRVIGKIVEKVLKEVELNNILTRLTGFNMPFSSVTSGIVTYFIYFIAIVMALDTLGLDTFVFNLIAFAVILVIILSVLLALKDFIPNFFAGIFIRQKRLIKPGDKIKFGNVSGKVISIDSIETVVETKKKDILYIPNASLVNQEVVKLK